MCLQKQFFKLAGRMLATMSKLTCYCHPIMCFNESICLLLCVSLINRTYLTNSGDFDVRKEEWKSLTSPVVEDVCKLGYSFCRELNYQHPRTTMLMFGPKNAPTKQTHYLYVPFENTNNGDFTIENIAKSKITKFAILFITQFDGVPMADVFKVLQYQFYENVDNKCTVRIGLQMYYIKSSMFKSQIMSGTKEELGSQIAGWLEYVKKRSAGGVGTEIAPAGAGGATGAEVSSPLTSGNAAGPTTSLIAGGQGVQYASHANGAASQDLKQQLINAAMNNIPVVVLLVLVFLFFFMHIWYTRSQLAYLTMKVEKLQTFQRNVLVDLITKVNNGHACKNI